MNKIKTVLVATVATMAMASCAQKASNETKTLVLYYSQTGVTSRVAHELQSRLGADIDSIEAVDPYTGTFEETIGRCQQEMNDGVMPALKSLGVDLAKYDTIYLGYPVWFGTYARPMMAFLQSVKLDGKVIVPFCTFGSGGLLESIGQLKADQPGATVLEGYGVRAARIEAMPEEIDRFLKEHHLIAGQVEPLPAYGDLQPVSEQEKSLFAAACNDYPFPLGTPVEAASRTTPTGTDYMFKAENAMPNDPTVKTKLTVYVTVREGQQPVFTRVDR